MKGNRYIPPIFFDLLEMGSRLFPKAKKTKKTSAKTLRSKKTRTTLSKKRVSADFGLKPVLLILVSLAFAIKGQMEWIQVSQPKTIWTGCAYYFVAIILFIVAMKPWKREGLQREPLPAKIEWSFFAVIMFLAAFLRLYKLDILPNGVFMDQGLIGWSGLRILHEGWRPTEEWAQFGNPVFLLYQVAAWFVFFKPTQFNLYLFFAVMSLATFPLAYWTLRQLAGSRIALLTLYLFAVMRWDINFSRNGFPSVQVPFYMFGAIAFLLYGLRNQKPWPLKDFPLVKRLAVLMPVALLVFTLYSFDAHKIFSLIWLAILLIILSVLLFGYSIQHREGIFWIRENWPFVVAAVFCSLGSFYTYQALKLLPVLLLLYGGYEFCAERERLLKALRRIISFAVIFLLVGSPMIFNMVKTHDIGGTRESGNSIVEEIHQQHSLQPLYNMVTKTLLMCNRTGDDNERHNYPNYRMLDDISGTLFILGVFYALSKIYRRKYFYGIMGIIAMTIPCLISVVPAHANRMMGVTFFVCFMVATPISALWGRLREKWGTTGEIALFLILAEPLFLIAVQNYNFYFHKMGEENTYWSTSYWGAYSYDASVIGKSIAESGDAYDYYLYTRYFNHSTIKYLAYNQRDHVKELEIPASFAPLHTEANRGLFYAFLPEQEGYLKLVQSLYPKCETQGIKDLTGRNILYLVKIPAESVAQAKGLKAEYSDGRTTNFPAFPKDLPAGPYEVNLTGSLYVGTTDNYRFEAKTNCALTWSVGHHSIRGHKSLKLAKGFYPVEIHLSVPSGIPSLELTLAPQTGRPVPIDNTCLTALDLSHGLHATYFDTTHPPDERLALEQWDPVVNFFNGTDFPYTNYQEKAHWEGVLEAPSTGDYQFSARTDEMAQIKIDGREVTPFGPNANGNIHLLAGPHQFEARFQKVLGPSLTLYWIPPGARNAEIIPNSVFGRAD